MNQYQPDYDYYGQKVKREELQIVHTTNPCLSYADIANMFDISRERVRQICGNRHSHKSELRYLNSITTLKCTRCNKILVRSNWKIKRCIKLNPNWKPYCSVLCSLKYYHEKGRWKNPKPAKSERNFEIINLYSQGISQYRLAKIYKLSQSRISAIIRRFDSKE